MAYSMQRSKKCTQNFSWKHEWKIYHTCENQNETACELNSSSSGKVLVNTVENFLLPQKVKNFLTDRSTTSQQDFVP
jgi:hypothetical protein